MPKQYSVSSSNASSSSLSPPPYSAKAPKRKTKPKSTPTNEPGRRQNSSCSACRIRRVKCNLRERQALVEEIVEKNKLLGLTDDGIQDSSLVSCSNCEDRGMNCIDEFSSVRKVKQFRKGKLLKELKKTLSFSCSTPEHRLHSFIDPHLNELNADVDDVEKPLVSVHRQHSVSYIDLPQTHHIHGGDIQSPGAFATQDAWWPHPPITVEFLESPFYRRLHLQRPIVDPADFLARFNHGELGPIGTCLARVFYAWALSFGVTHTGIEPQHPPTASTRQASGETANHAVELLLAEIDNLGIMRKPTWDGIRVVLFLLPLAGEVLSPMQIQSMYESVYSQVLALAEGTELSPDWNGAVNPFAISEGENLLVRTRVFWYCFTHESVNSALTGRRLIFDSEDIILFSPKSPVPQALTNISPYYRNFVAYTAPVSNVSSSLRLANEALYNRRTRGVVNEKVLLSALDILDKSWNDLDATREIGPVGMMMLEDVENYCNGWQLIISQAYQIIYSGLLDKLATSTPDMVTTLQNRLIPRVLNKSVSMIKGVSKIARSQIGSSFFQFDSAMIQVATFFAAVTLAETNGTDEDINSFISAFREMRFAHSKVEERVQLIEQAWLQRVDRDQLVTVSLIPEFRRLSVIDLMRDPFGAFTDDTPSTDTLRASQSQQTQFYHTSAYPSYDATVSSFTEATTTNSGIYSEILTPVVSTSTSTSTSSSWGVQPYHMSQPSYATTPFGSPPAQHSYFEYSAPPDFDTSYAPSTTSLFGDSGFQLTEPSQPPMSQPPTVYEAALPSLQPPLLFRAVSYTGLPTTVAQTIYEAPATISHHRSTSS